MASPFRNNKSQHGCDLAGSRVVPGSLGPWAGALRSQRWWQADPLYHTAASALLICWCQIRSRCHFGWFPGCFSEEVENWGLAEIFEGILHVTAVIDQKILALHLPVKP